MSNMPKNNIFRDSEVEAWLPKASLLPSEWAEKYRVLKSQAQEKGPLNMDRTPYLRGVIDAPAVLGCSDVVFAKPAQVAGTEGMVSILGYFAHFEPCSIGVVLADEKTADYIGRERIQSMFQDSPELSRLINSERFSKTEIKLLNGSFIQVVWASSVAQLGTKNFRIMINDEVDKEGYYAKSKEASALSLSDERTESYLNGLHFYLSTPTLETGNIYQLLKSCDAVFDFHVPCSKCGRRQPLIWSREHADGFPKGTYRGKNGRRYRLGGVVWQGGTDATPAQINRAGYRCGGCGAVWTTAQKNIAVLKGEWVSRTKPPAQIIRAGFHISRLYSLLGVSGDLPKLVRAFIKAKKSGDPKQLQGFINSSLAEPWKKTVAKKTESQIMRAKCALPPQTVPEQAVALTCGVDVQKFGFWFVVRAWSWDFTSWLIHYGFLPTWESLEQLLFETRYPIQGASRKAGIWRAAIDTGGGKFEDLSMTEKAYWWIRANGFGRGCNCWGTKGASRPIAGRVHIGKALDKTPSGKALPGGLQIILLNTDALKDAYHYRINQAHEDAVQAAYLHAGTGIDYAQQIMAEEKRINDKGLEEWVQIKADNHLLDAEIAAHACADPEWIGGGVNLYRPIKPAETKTSKPAAVKRGRSRSRW